VQRRRYSSLQQGFFADARGRFAHKLSRYGERRRTYLSTEESLALDKARGWGIDVLLLDLLRAGELPPPRRPIEQGRAALEDYRSRNSEASLDWDELVSEGWIRQVWGEWHTAGKLGMRKPGDEEADEGHFRRFFHWLTHQFPRRASRLALPNLEPLLCQHRFRYPGAPDEAGLLSQQILSRTEDSVLVLNTRSPLFEHLAPWLYARLWDGLVAGPLDPDQRLTWWARYLDLGSGWYTCRARSGTSLLWSRSR